MTRSPSDPDGAGEMRLALPWLMRAAGDVYRDAMRASLQDAGCDDLPRRAAFVLAGLDRSGPDPRFRAQASVVASLQMSKQGASQLIDTMVLRDYLERRIDPEDRRRMEIRLTVRGRVAADAIQDAIDQVDAAVAQLVTSEELHGLRAALGAFEQIRARSD